MKATIVTPFMLSPLAPVAIGDSSANFRNYLLSRAFIRGNQKPRSSIIFVNFSNFVNLFEHRPRFVDWYDDLPEHGFGNLIFLLTIAIGSCNSDVLEVRLDLPQSTQQDSRARLS